MEQRPAAEYSLTFVSVAQCEETDTATLSSPKVARLGTRHAFARFVDTSKLGSAMLVADSSYTKSVITTSLVSAAMFTAGILLLLFT